MRTLALLPLLMLAACGGDNDAGDPAAMTGPGEGLGAAFYELGERSGLCASSDNSASLIVYGENDANCMVEGRIDTADGGAMALVPRGDDQCRIPIEDLGQSIRLGDGGDACAYYCGGDARYAGRELIKNWDETPDLRDAAGDPIC